MKKALRILVTALALLAIMVIPVIAGGPPAGKGGRSGQAGKSNVGHLCLWPWPDPEEPGPWGKIKYNLSGDTLEFVFNGHGLEPETKYVLKSCAVVLGEATANGGGNVHISRSVDASAIKSGGKFNLRLFVGNARILRSLDNHDFEYIP